MCQCSDILFSNTLILKGNTRSINWSGQFKDMTACSTSKTMRRIRHSRSFIYLRDNSAVAMKVLTFVVSILIIIAVLIPGSNIPSVSFAGVDKFVHITMFASWAVAIAFDFRTVKPWIIFLLGLLFSLITEILQLFVEGRSFDFYDMIADGAGLILGLLLAKPFIKIMSRLFGQKA
jgi:VanZ family protein